MASVQRTVKAKFDGDAQGLVRAAKDGEREIDRFAKSVDKKFRKSGDDSGKNFNQALKKWISPSSLGKVGQEGGTVFGSGFLGMLKTPVLGPAIAGALTAAAAVAAPAAGAVAASGLVLAFGAGLAGLGIAFAAQSDVVKKRWRTTVTEMSADLRLFSKPYEDTLVHAADVADRVFAKFKPSLQAAFKETAPVVSDFVDEVGDGLEELQPAIRPISEGFQAVLTSLGPALQSAMRSTSDGLVKLAESVKQNPDGLADLVDGVGQLTEKALGALTALNDFNGKITDLTGGTSAVDLLFGKANSKIGEFIRIAKNAVDPLSGLKGGLDAVLGSADKTTGAVGLTGDAVKYYTQGLDENQVAAILAGKSTDGLIPKVDALTQKFNAQLAATRAENAELFKKSGLLLSLSGATISYEEAVDAATASVKENGRTLDLNTSAGRANQTALDNLASAANAKTEAMRNSNQGDVAAARAAEESRKSFVKQAVQMGLSKTEAEKLARSLIDIPNVTRTAKLEANKKDLEQKLAAATKQLADPKLTASKKAKLLAEIANLKSGIAEAKRLLANVPSSKTVTIKYTSTGVNVTSPSSVGRRASGGLTQPRRQYLLGERGPEIAEFSGSGAPRILSAEQTRQELARSDQPIVVENHIEIGGEVVRVVRSEIRTNNRELKRTVTAGAR